MGKHPAGNYSKTPRLYVKERLAENARMELSKESSHYLVQVLRVKPGALVRVFNGTDGEWLAEVSDASRKAVTLTLREKLRAQQEETLLNVTLCFAPVKNAPQHFLVQKATELGVSVLQPVITRHTIVTRVNTERLYANAVEAAEQCERLSVPEVRAAVPLAALLGQDDTSCQWIMGDESGHGKPFAEALSACSARAYALLIGPEGGFSEEEHQKLRSEKQMLRVGLGPRILRADTAALAALTCLQAMKGDWHHPPRFTPLDTTS